MPTYSCPFNPVGFWGRGPLGQPFGLLFGPFLFVVFSLLSISIWCSFARILVLFTRPRLLSSNVKSRVLSFLEEAVDFGKFSPVQFVPRGLIRLTFKDPVDKERLVSQESIMLDNVECDVTPSDRPNTMVYVHHYPAEGDDALLCAEFRRYSKIVSVKHQYFSGRPNLLTGSRVLTMSLSKQIPAEVFVDSYPTRVWHRGMAPFCQICKTMGHKAAD